MGCCNRLMSQLSAVKPNRHGVGGSTQLERLNRMSSMHAWHAERPTVRKLPIHLQPAPSKPSGWVQTLPVHPASLPGTCAPPSCRYASSQPQAQPLGAERRYENQASVRRMARVRHRRATRTLRAAVESSPDVGSSCDDTYNQGYVTAGLGLLTALYDRCIDSVRSVCPHVTACTGTTMH